MNFVKTLLGFKQEVDLKITRYFDENISQARKRDKFLADILVYAKKISLEGGKRLRPALFFYGAISTGRNKLERKKLIRLAAAIELVHIFLLIHDDVIDRGDLRHGIATINSQYAKIGKKIFKLKDSQHFGNSVAIIMGDMVYTMAMELIIEAGLDARKSNEIILKLQKIVANTIIGQSQDMLIECKKTVLEKEVLKMYENKTAKYSFEGPLHLGLILADGKNEKVLKGFSEYAMALGIAFQIQDDIMGIFGNEKKMGKSAQSDITEGKKTILVLKAQQNATAAQRKSMQQILGNSAITKKDILEFQKIIRETGALEYASKMASGYIRKAQRVIVGLKINSETKEFLTGMADYLEAREI